jgi:gliding motility-associated-like protein
MRKLVLLLLTVFCCSISALASHIIGGEITYTFISFDAATNTYQYEVTLKLYRDCLNSSVTFQPALNVQVYNTVNNTLVKTESLPLITENSVFTSNTISCIANPQNVCYRVGIYRKIIELNRSADGYTLSTPACCRVGGLSNITNSANTGSTYVAYIPSHDAAAINSSVFTAGDSVKVICLNKPVSFRFSISDPDGDDLTYSFCNAYNGNNTNIIPPPFNTLNYQNGFTGSNPLGGIPPALTIDPNTGVISGFVSDQGNYVVTICIRESRNGVTLNEYRKEFQFSALDCPEIITPAVTNCRNFGVTFSHDNDPQLQYNWDFGVTGITTDTSSQVQPTYLYPDTGRFIVKMKVQRGANCVDSFYTTASVYPGFNAAMQLPPAPLCSGGLLTFRDNSTTSFGIVNGWKWYNLTNGNTIASTQSFYSNTFTTPGIKTIALVATSSLGCRDSITRTIDLARGPLIDAGPDQGLCIGDTLQLNVSSDGDSFSWSPAAGMDDPTAQSPRFFTTTTRNYEVRAFIAGCVSIDSIRIRTAPIPTVTVNSNRNFICFGDTAQFAAGTGSRYQWIPAAGLSNPNSAQPRAYPRISTMYKVFVTDTLGCSKAGVDSVFLRAIPKINVNAGRDTFVIKGNPIRLNATGASLYNWQPAQVLNNPALAQPIALLNGTTTFTVRGYTPEGCEGFDTMKVVWLEYDPDIYVPSAFSPNNDGHNNILRPIGYGVQYIDYFAVYNRWGQQVYFTKVFGNGWDGNINGKPQPQGVYVWHLVARDFMGRIIQKKGSVMLVR